jgi:hypothetical protein
MPKGGARVNSGPPPDPNALRRDRASDSDGWTLLPSGGRTADAPPWPLLSHVGQQTDLEHHVNVEATDRRELAVWLDIWRTPQACAWERLGWTLDVALYVRLMVGAEAGDFKAASEARQWSDRLGLNPAAMLRNRWRIVEDELGPRRNGAAPSGTTPKAGQSARDRLRAARNA